MHHHAMQAIYFTHKVKIILKELTSMVVCTSMVVHNGNPST